MINKILKKILDSPYLLLLLGILGLVSAVSLDLFFWRKPILKEGGPNFSPGHILRTIAILTSVILLIRSLYLSNMSGPTIKVNFGSFKQRMYFFWTFFISALFLFLFIYFPGAFNTLNYEDGLIENASFILLACCSVLFTTAFISCLWDGKAREIRSWIIFLFAFMFLLIALEEISWFQRIFDFETPESFQSNLQKEFNLHNFGTNKVESAYYFGAFLFMVILPLLGLFFSDFFKSRSLLLFLPQPYIIVVGSIACAYNYDMWNIIFTQISFFSSVVILILLSTFSVNKETRNWSLFSALFVIVTQVFFILFQENFVGYRVWGVTEYKELFIPLAFLFYSIDVIRNWRFVKSDHFEKVLH